MSDDKTPETIRSDSSVKLKVMINPAIKLASDRITFGFCIDGTDEPSSDRLSSFIWITRNRSDEIDDGYEAQINCDESIPLSVLFSDRLFDLSSFLQARDAGMMADYWYDYVVVALNQVLMTGTLTFELDDDGSGSRIDNPHNMVIAIYQLGKFETSLNLGRLTEEPIKHFFLDAEADQSADET